MGNIWIGGGFLQTEGNRLVAMGEEHALIHEGDMYTASYMWSGVADGGSVLLSGVIPENMYPHSVFSVNTSGNSKIELIEGGTLTGGTAVVAYNRNRNNSSPSVGTIAYHSGTITGGSVVYTAFLPGGAKNFAAGVGARDSSEWVYLDNATTTFRVTNLAGGTAFISLQANYYMGAED